MENHNKIGSLDSESTHMLPFCAGASFQPGTILLEKFRVVELLGSGGMGSVYRVDHLLLEKQFALKCLNKFQEVDASWKRFQNEAKAAQLLDHPNLLKVFDFGLLESGQPFFLMELIEGKTLGDEIKSLGHLPAHRAVSLFIQVAFAIACAHDQKVVHRDLKPSNIMLVAPKGGNERESVKVVDFGIAKLTGMDEFNQQTLTRTGEIFGSPYYMSPEQCMGLPVDHRSDLYSLGCVFYETLTSAPPFMGETALSTMMKHQSEKQLSLKEASMGANYPAVLESVIEKLLEKEPDKRYQSAQHLARDLISIERSLSQDEGAVEVRVTDGAAARDKAPLLKPVEPKKIGGVVKLVVSGAFVYILGIATAYLYFKNTTPPAPPPPSAAAQPKSDPYPRYWSQMQGNLKVFNFPAFPVGLLIGPNNMSKPAAGRVAIDASDQIGLVLDNEVDKDPSLLARFRQDDLSVLDYCGVSGNSSIYSIFKDFVGLRCLNVSGTNFSDRDLAILPNLKNLIYLNLSTTDVDCTQLAKYKEIYNLQFLDISHTNRPEDVLKLIPNFKNLQQLAVATNAIGDAEVKLIGKSKTIRVLNLCHNVITDKGVSYLSNMQSLEWLDLSSTQITPKCVKSLVKLKNLKQLEIMPSDWTTAHVDAFSLELRKANPKVQIVYQNRATYDPTVLQPFRWGSIGLMTHPNLDRVLPYDTEKKKP